jgi:hypothetical protein
MADIKYLAGLDIDGNINLNTNQLQFAVIQPDTSDPTAQTPQVGQIYYKSDTQALRIYSGPTDGWVSVGQDSNNYVKSGTFNDSNGTITLVREGLIDVSITGLVKSGDIPTNNNQLTNGEGYITGSSASTLTNKSGNISQWTNDSGYISTYFETSTLANVLSRGNTTGGTDIAVSAGDDITLTDSSKIILDSNFQIYKTLGNNAIISETGLGDLLLLSNNEVEIKSGELGETYAKFTKDAGIELYTNDSKKFETTSTGITITGKGLSTATATTDGATTLTTKGYVDSEISSAIAGQLVFQGGYDASTNPPTGTGILKGYTYVVTTAGSGTGGSFWSVPLEVGDLIIAESDQPTTESDWTEVNKNIDIATTSTVGIVQPSSDNFAISGTGLLTIKNGGVILGTETTGSYVSDLTGGTNVTVSSASGSVTINGLSNTAIGDIAEDKIEARQYQGLIGNGSLTDVPVTSSTHGLGTDSSQFMIQLIEVSSGETVFAEVTRGASGLVTIGFTTAPASNSIRILIQKIG